MKKRLVMIIILVILLVGTGVGVGAFFLLQNGDEPSNVDLNGGYVNNGYSDNGDQNNEYINGDYANNEHPNGEYPNNGETNGEHQSGEEPNEEYTNGEDEVITNPWPVIYYIGEDGLPQYIPGSVRLHPGGAEGLQDEWLLRSTPQHRMVFYFLDGRFSAMVSVVEDRAFKERYTDFTDGMMLMHFVQYFNISREEFDAVLEEVRASHERLAQEFSSFDLSFEQYELPNADIIFTFDPEIISHFYRRE